MARHRGLTKALGPENRSPGAVVPTEFVPFRDRKVKTRIVACTICGAAAETPCIDSTGKPRQAHPARRRLALRAGG
jgi:hypothetical protein